MKRNETRLKIEEVEMELADLYSMSEEAVCFRYNTDTKQEAIEALNDELTTLYEEMKNMESGELNWGGVDPAFGTMADFDRMRV